MENIQRPEMLDMYKKLKSFLTKIAICIMYTRDVGYVFRGPTQFMSSYW